MEYDMADTEIKVTMKLMNKINKKERIKTGD